MVKERSALIAGLALVLAVTAEGGVQSRSRGASNGILLPDGTSLPIGTAHAGPDYVSLWINGLIEYGFAPTPDMSPTPSSQYPRPAEVIGDWFLRVNQAALGLLQDPADFERMSTDVQCDGTEVVVYRQRFNFTPVETSYIRLSISGQVVRQVDSRFVVQPWLLPICQGAPPTGRPAQDMRYLPTGTNTVVVVTTIDQLRHEVVETVWNLCTLERIGSTTRYN